MTTKNEVKLEIEQLVLPNFQKLVEKHSLTVVKLPNGHIRVIANKKR